VAQAIDLAGNLVGAGKAGVDIVENGGPEKGPGVVF